MFEYWRWHNSAWLLQAESRFKIEGNAVTWSAAPVSNVTIAFVTFMVDSHSAANITELQGPRFPIT